MSQKEIPLWMVGDTFNEALFCMMFLHDHPMKYIGKSLYTVDGVITDETVLKKTIYDMIELYIPSGIAKKAAALLENIKLKAYSEGLTPQTDRIHVANGTLFLDGTFAEEKEFCINRLPVAYNSSAPEPVNWLRFLNELLYPEDIPTLQEYMGYCLIPTTKAQKMLFIIGKGGEGKSRIGLVMNALFGSSMKTGSIQKVETNTFAPADLEHLLVMVDDDMKLEALPQTNRIKSIVTAELLMDLEKKGQQSYQGMLYVRFIVFGNGIMKSLYDRSEGFYRRQLIVTTMDKPKDRIDDPDIGESLCSEAEGIFLWALEGLKRLIANRYRFTISQRTLSNMESAIRDGNNVIEFMASKGYFRFKADGEITSKDLYAIYKGWCEDNAYHPVTPKSFTTYLHQHEAEYKLEYNNLIRNSLDKRVWGFTGIEAGG